jgi:hypothetical protein
MSRGDICHECSKTTSCLGCVCCQSKRVISTAEMQTNLITTIIIQPITNKGYEFLEGEKDAKYKG